MKHTAFTLLMTAALVAPVAAAKADIVRSDRDGRMMYNDQVYRSEAYGGMNQRVHYLDRKEVQAIQQALDESGFYTAGVDGVWGPKTTKAVQDFQVSSGLEPTGTINEATLDQLGLQLSAADQVDSKNDPIQWRGRDMSNYEPQEQRVYEDRMSSGYGERPYTHMNDR